jgi:hypothetical protein
MARPARLGAGLAGNVGGGDRTWLLILPHIRVSTLH